VCLQGPIKLRFPGKPWFVFSGRSDGRKCLGVWTFSRLLQVRHFNGRWFFSRRDSTIVARRGVPAVWTFLEGGAEASCHRARASTVTTPRRNVGYATLLFGASSYLRKASCHRARAPTVTTPRRNVGYATLLFGASSYVRKTSCHRARAPTVTDAAAQCRICYFTFRRVELRAKNVLSPRPRTHRNDATVHVGYATLLSGASSYLRKASCHRARAPTETTQRRNVG
jgi:hypothetical protein